VSGFRDRIAEVIYVRDRFDGPAQDTADVILAMPEMQAVGELIDVVTLWAAMKVTSANLLGEFRSMQEMLGPVYLAIEGAGRP
jgi:hypothetical protein